MTHVSTGQWARTDLSPTKDDFASERISNLLVMGRTTFTFDLGVLKDGRSSKENCCGAYTQSPSYEGEITDVSLGSVSLLMSHNTTQGCCFFSCMASSPTPAFIFNFRFQRSRKPQESSEQKNIVGLHKVFF